MVTLFSAFFWKWDHYALKCFLVIFFQIEKFILPNGHLFLSVLGLSFFNLKNFHFLAFGLLYSHDLYYGKDVSKYPKRSKFSGFTSLFWPTQTVLGKGHRHCITSKPLFKFAGFSSFSSIFCKNVRWSKMDF